jgi:hypothetical protein
MEENLANCIETEGKTVDDAVANALTRLGVEQKDVEIEVLDEGSRGVFNILGRCPASRFPAAARNPSRTPQWSSAAFLRPWDSRRRLNPGKLRTA